MQKGNRLRICLDWAPAIGIAAGIFALSSIPGSAFPSIRWPYADKIAHAALYGLLGLLLALALRRTGRTWGWVRLIAVATIIAAAYGITDELHQKLTPFRSPDPFDAMADAVGALFGAAFYAIVARARKR
ncbi:MAG: VanZ family protein [Deltaproteobacteria bacterium]|nr:VanZ family protein [Deltaproteobacteria bacterium]